MSSSVLKISPPVWDLSLEPSVYMLTAFSNWCERLSQSVRVGNDLVSSFEVDNGLNVVCNIWYGYMIG